MLLKMPCWSEAESDAKSAAVPPRLAISLAMAARAALLVIPLALSVADAPEPPRNSSTLRPLALMAVPFGMSPAHSRFGLLVSTVVPGFALALASLMRSRMAL